MTQKSEYAKKLRDPRWQRKRLEVMNRDEFTCKICGAKDKTLNVHHCFYDGREPWEYKDISLTTLCEDCHQNEAVESRNSREFLFSVLCCGGTLSKEIADLAYTIEFSDIPAKEIVKVLIELVDAYASITHG